MLSKAPEFKQIAFSADGKIFLLGADGCVYMESLTPSEDGRGMLCWLCLDWPVFTKDEKGKRDA